MWTLPPQTSFSAQALPRTVALTVGMSLTACSPLFLPEDETIAVVEPPAVSGVHSTAITPSTISNPVNTRASNTATAEIVEIAPEVTQELRVLRPYLRGNTKFGWQPGQLGGPEEFWNKRVNQLPVNPESDAVTTYLAHVSRTEKSDPNSEFFGQFDLGKKAKGENYSFHILESDATTPRYDFTPRLRSNGYPEDEFYAPHCDRIAMPVPIDGRLQGEADYRCTGGGDCHLYVVASDEGRIYEQWRADNPGPDKKKYAGGCTNVWDLSAPQPDNLRGLSCTSANAAGIPYIPLLFTPGEIKAGVIRHAIAFTLPNGWVERDTYARPATHNPLVSKRWGPAEQAPGQAMRYGSHFRLEQDFEILPSWPPSLKVVLQALKDYGMYHIDGGPRMLIASNDAFSQHHWDDPEIALNPHDLTRVADLSWKNFELISAAGNTGNMQDKNCRRRAQREKPPRSKAKASL